MSTNFAPLDAYLYLFYFVRDFKLLDIDNPHFEQMIKSDISS